MRIFDNPLNIPASVAQSRLRDVDRNAVAVSYDMQVGDTQAVAHYLAIDSSVSDSAIINSLTIATSAEEQNEYQNTINQLTTIENYVNPTNAQVIAAVKYLARTLRLLIKLFVRYY